MITDANNLSSSKMELIGLPNFPLVEPGDNLTTLLESSLVDSKITLHDGDCLVIAQKVVSKAENRYAYLNDVEPTLEASTLANQTNKDPRLVQLVLDESVEVLKHRPGAIIVEHRLGYVHANAGIDQSNIDINPDNPRVLLLPVDPDKSAATLRSNLQKKIGASVNIIISDSAGRAWRNGIIGFAIGTAGFEPIQNEIGKKDLFGQTLNVTQVAIADELAAAASVLMGQANQGMPVVLIRGVKLDTSVHGSKGLIRSKQEDLFR